MQDYRKKYLGLPEAACCLKAMGWCAVPYKPSERSENKSHVDKFSPVTHWILCYITWRDFDYSKLPEFGSRPIYYSDDERCNPEEDTRGNSSPSLLPLPSARDIMLCISSVHLQRLYIHSEFICDTHIHASHFQQFHNASYAVLFCMWCGRLLLWASLQLVPPQHQMLVAMYGAVAVTVNFNFSNSFPVFFPLHPRKSGLLFFSFRSRPLNPAKGSGEWDRAGKPTALLRPLRDHTGEVPAENKYLCNFLLQNTSGGNNFASFLCNRSNKVGTKRQNYTETSRTLEH